MSVSIRPFFTAQFAPNAQTTLYTASGVRAIVDKFTGFNATGAAVTLAINIAPNAGTAGASNVVVLKSIAAGETYMFPEVVGQAIEAGGAISVVAGAANAIVIRSSGREVS
jgi:hypothetical protein